MKEAKINKVNRIFMSFIVTAIAYIVVESIRNTEVKMDNNLVYILAIILSILIYITNMNFNLVKNEYIDTKPLHKPNLTLHDKIFIILAGYLIEKLFAFFFYFGLSPHQKELNNEYDSHSFSELMLADSLVPGIIEEILNRGLIYLLVYGLVILINSIRDKENDQNNKLYKSHGFIFLILSSLWFGYGHISNFGEIKYMWVHVASGFVLGLIFLITKDLKLSICIHAMGNALAVMYDYSDLTSNIRFFISGAIILYVVIVIIYSVIDAGVRKERSFLYRKLKLLLGFLEGKKENNRIYKRLHYKIKRLLDI